MLAKLFEPILPHDQGVNSHASYQYVEKSQVRRINQCLGDLAKIRQTKILCNDKSDLIVTLIKV